MTENNEKIKGMRRSSKFKSIRKDLLEQLEINGVTSEFYLDLVEDYMTMWIHKCLLKEDIEERGVSVEWNNGGGQRGFKKNESIAEFNKTNAQMLKLLDDLGIKPSPSEENEDDDL